MANQIYAGAAKVNMTPPKEYFPLFNKPNFIGGGPDSIFSCVYRDIHCRAIALECGEERVVILSMELGMPNGLNDRKGERFIKAAAEAAGVPEKNIMYSVTHNHNCLDFGIARMMKEKNPDLYEKATKYEEILVGVVTEAVKKAVKELRPAKVGFGRSECYANVNRHCYSEEGQPSIAGFEIDRPSDREIIVLNILDLEDKPIAMIYNYAAHASLLANNKPDGVHTELSGDWPGEVSLKFEAMYDEKAVAMHLPGAGGDQNMVMIGRVYDVTPDGKGVMHDFGPVGYTVLDFMSNMVVRDTKKAIANITKYKEKSKMWIRSRTMDITRDYYDFDGGKFNNSQPGAKDLKFSFTVLMIGDIALAAMGGEIYTSIGMRIKQDSPYHDTMFVTHTGIPSGYIKDDSGTGKSELAIRKNLFELMHEYSDDIEE